MTAMTDAPLAITVSPVPPPHPDGDVPCPSEPQFHPGGRLEWNFGLQFQRDQQGVGHGHE